MKAIIQSLAFAGLLATATLGASAAHAGLAAPGAETIASYRNRFARDKPVIAVIAENSGTELTDFVVPYGVLAQSGVADVFAVAAQDGAITMRPALHLRAQASLAQFDSRFPQGADYIIVPAMVRQDDPAVLAWIRAQADKGGTVVSTCDGALVLANAGLLKNRRATAHWATQSLRRKKYPDTTWLGNVRYVVDGRIVTSAGISAAMPTSLALVEAIAGRDAASRLAEALGVGDWSANHDSDQFLPKFGVNLRAFAAVMVTNGWFHSTQQIGVPLSAGMDEIALALTADAYSRTGRSQAVSMAASDAPVVTRNGLVVLPDRVERGSDTVDRMLAAPGTLPSARALDIALVDIASLYGRNTAYGVALDFEYPGFRR